MTTSIKVLPTGAPAVMALFAFAVVQPVLGLLGEQPGFFVANGFDGLAIVLFALLLSAAVPLVLLLALAGLTRLQPRAGEWMLNFCLFVLGTLLVLSLAGPRLPVPGAVMLLLALAGGLGITLLFLHKEGFRSLLVFLSCGLVIFPLVFLLASPASDIIRAKPADPAESVIGPPDPEKAYPPVVFLVWDELPIVTLLDGNGQIDRVRYPNFARFADDATWYSHTYSVAASTLWAVPAILTGQRPADQEHHTAGEQAINLFTLLGRTHTFGNVVEKHTALCPETLCREDKNRLDLIEDRLPDIGVIYLHLIAPHDWADALPDISHNWGGFADAIEAPAPEAETKATITPAPKAPDHPADNDTLEAEKPKSGKNRLIGAHMNNAPTKKAYPNHKKGIFYNFLEDIDAYRPGEKPPLHFLHIVFPHVPYNYMPSGKYHSIGTHKYFSEWENEREIFFDYQRHLLQMGAVDRFFGDFINRLKEQGLYENALIIVVADHGASWRKPGNERRALNKANYPELVSVPLFIKYPAQTQPEVVETPARTMDILPTLADYLDIGLPEGVDGQSLLAETRSVFDAIEVIDNHGEERFRLPLPSTDEMRQLVQRKIDWFGTGEMNAVFENGPFAEYRDKPVADYQVRPASGLSFRLDQPEDYQAYDPAGDYVPALVTGQVSASDARSLPKQLVVAVNGILREPYPLLKQIDNQLIFAATVPEESFKHGQNRIRLFAFDPAWPDTLREIAGDHPSQLPEP